MVPTTTPTFEFAACTMRLPSSRLARVSPPRKRPSQHNDGARLGALRKAVCPVKARMTAVAHRPVAPDVQAVQAALACAGLALTLVGVGVVVRPLPCLNTAVDTAVRSGSTPLAVNPAMKSQVVGTRAPLWVTVAHAVLRRFQIRGAVPLPAAVVSVAVATAAMFTVAAVDLADRVVWGPDVAGNAGVAVAVNPVVMHLTPAPPVVRAAAAVHGTGSAAVPATQRVAVANEAVIVRPAQALGVSLYVAVLNTARRRYSLGAWWRQTKRVTVQACPAAVVDAPGFGPVPESLTVGHIADLLAVHDPPYTY